MHQQLCPFTTQWSIGGGTTITVHGIKFRDLVACIASLALEPVRAGASSTQEAFGGVNFSRRDLKCHLCVAVFSLPSGTIRPKGSLRNKHGAFTFDSASKCPCPLSYLFD